MTATTRAMPASATLASRARVDVVALVGGISVAVIGLLLLLDVLDALNLRFAALAPIACAAVGGVLLARGLEGGPGRADAPTEPE
jgi:glutamine amidotransferase PdxT